MNLKNYGHRSTLIPVFIGHVDFTDHVISLSFIALNTYDIVIGAESSRTGHTKRSTTPETELDGCYL